MAISRWLDKEAFEVYNESTKSVDSTILFREDFLADFVDDIEDLPTEGILTGSVAFCIEDAKKYILSNFRTWGPVGERPVNPDDVDESQEDNA